MRPPELSSALRLHAYRAAGSAGARLFPLRRDDRRHATVTPPPTIGSRGRIFPHGRPGSESAWELGALMRAPGMPRDGPISVQ